jgi:hypothetical protein
MVTRRRRSVPPRECLVGDGARQAPITGRRESVSDDQDWRLKAELAALEPDDKRSTLDRLLARVREPAVVREVGAAVGHDVAITHDGKTLLAYAASESGLATARKAIQAVLRQDNVIASISVSHWDERFDEWLQIDPPLTGKAKRAEEVAEHDAERVESRTMVASTGKLIRSEVEQTMRNWADKARPALRGDRAPAPAHDPGRLHGHRPEAQARRVRERAARGGVGDDAHRARSDAESAVAANRWRREPVGRGASPRSWSRSAISTRCAAAAQRFRSSLVNRRRSPPKRKSKKAREVRQAMTASSAI